MTFDRAIHLAKAQADGGVYSWAVGEAEEYHQLVLAALRAQAEAEKNKPLTLDELREMDLDEWVWIENLDTEDPFAHKSNYYQKLVTPECDILVGGTFWGYPGGNWHRFYWSGYGKTWLAYRHKPEARHDD